MNPDIVTILLVEDSPADAQAFALQIAKNPQVRYEVDLKHVTDLDQAIAWLRQNDPPYLICLDSDILTAYPQDRTSFVRQLLDEINGYGPTVWLSGNDTKNVVRLLRHLGIQEEVFQKQSTLWGSQQQQFLELLNHLVTQRSSGKTREIQIATARVEERIRTLEHDIEELRRQLSRVSQSLYEGGESSIAAIAMRYSNSARTYARAKELNELGDRLGKLESTIASQNNELKLKRAEFWYGLLSRLGFWGTIALFFAIAALILGVERALELIKTLINS